jgi:hypothetical protein
METAPPTSPGADSKVATPSAPGVLLGIGLGGFLDGIVLHQILQWHHMLTSEGAAREANAQLVALRSLGEPLRAAGRRGREVWRIAAPYPRNDHDRAALLRSCDPPVRDRGERVD